VHVNEIIKTWTEKAHVEEITKAQPKRYVFLNNILQVYEAELISVYKMGD